MKVRSGFVSNSSSSSFVIITKKGELTEDMLRMALGDVAHSFPLGVEAFFEGIMNVVQRENEARLGGWCSVIVPLSEIAAPDIHVYTGEHEDNTGVKLYAALCGTDLTCDTEDLRIIWEPRS